MRMEHHATVWLALLAALAGCTGEPGPTSGAGWVPVGEQRLTFGGGVSAQRAVRSDDGSEIEEYGRAAGSGWQLEYLYLADDSADHALARSFDTARVPALFRRLAGMGTALGDAGRVERAEGAVVFRPFAIDGIGCIAFASDWPGHADEALVGYACGFDHGPLPRASIETLLAGFTIQPVVTPDHLPALPAAAEAQGFALGGDRPNVGLIAYPFELAKLSLRANTELL